MKVYFAASVSGGREDIDYYTLIVSVLRKFGCEIPTEHLGDATLFAKTENDISDQEICERCLSNWIPGCQLMIAEVTRTSIGVGYEIAYALGLGIPVVCFYRPAAIKRLSPMVKGNNRIKTVEYEGLKDLDAKIQVVMSSYL